MRANEAHQQNTNKVDYKIMAITKINCTPNQLINT